MPRGPFRRGCLSCKTRLNLAQMRVPIDVVQFVKRSNPLFPLSRNGDERLPPRLLAASRDFFPISSGNNLLVAKIFAATKSSERKAVTELLPGRAV
jgi:hypothetical protein